MIYQESLEFLKDLADNNNREWFLANRGRYDIARENVIDFTGQLLTKLQNIDPAIDETMDPKKRVMRIYRDIRFSKDKTPYKNNFGVNIPSTGLKAGTVEFYLQIQPGNSFIGGGYWMPEAANLKIIRQEIDYNASELKQIIDDKAFVKLFGEFRKQEQLKSVPREYSAKNENIDLLKLKSFVGWHKLTDEEITREGAVQLVADICSKIYPLNVFLKNALA
ncbi:DUF2461 domain-containing protein [Mucilaginibacter sp. FT3.2]|uniref:DUF2461 domain-containing protein n=1 Tax=Mucilaginibacter sp. FT3.2 TaxID=2723090 RepID=UPI00160B1028|nr:DUF2461 domain-containing protein [Mucilaginibacter sp. FT3.2]MBB6231087.1 uncharacterized protein (TIGR02453 family) [Mucilaginibacter sp. FT3.2]